MGCDAADPIAAAMRTIAKTRADRELCIDLSPPRLPPRLSRERALSAPQVRYRKPAIPESRQANYLESRFVRFTSLSRPKVEVTQKS